MIFFRNKLKSHINRLTWLNENMDDYQVAFLFSALILVPLAGWKITGIVKKISRMSNRGKRENVGLTTKQKEFVEFLEKASNQSKDRNEA